MQFHDNVSEEIEKIKKKFEKGEDLSFYDSKRNKVIFQIKDLNLVNINDRAYVCKLSNNSYLKVYLENFSKILDKYSRYDLRKSLRRGKSISNVSEIIVPSEILYKENNQVVGYITPSADGMSLGDYLLLKTSEGNFSFADRVKIFSKISDIVKRGNNIGINFPDIANYGNIFIDKQGNIKLIDYDGIQIDEIGRLTVSKMMIRNDSEYSHYKFNKKYSDGILYNSNFDIESLIEFFFYFAFDVDFKEKCCIINNPSQNKISKFLKSLGIDDTSLTEKLYLCINNNKNNAYITGDLLRISKLYDYDLEEYKKENYVLTKKTII